MNQGSDIFGSYAGSNNLIGVDPGFVRNPSAGADGTWGTPDDDYGDLHLASKSSPAYNASNNSLAVDADSTPLTTDHQGNPRILYGIAVQNFAFLEI